MEHRPLVSHVALCMRARIPMSFIGVLQNDDVSWITSAIVLE